MGEMLVAGTVAGIHDDLARGRVHGLARHAGTGGGERGGLRPVDDFEDLLHLVRGFADHERTRDVGLIAFHRATVVDEHDGARANGLRLHGTVRAGRVFVNWALA
jgi:hypothetical protein